MNKIIFLSILTLFVLTSECYSDNPRQKWKFRSSNGLYTLKFIDAKTDTIYYPDTDSYSLTYTETNWGVFNTLTGKLKYTINEFFSEKTAYVSNCGKFVVLINDYPPEQADDSLDLIHIYKKGNLVKSYALGDLFKCGYNISSSVSHFGWTFGKIKVSFFTNLIKFQTLELVDYKISLRSGKMKHKQLDSNLNDSSILVYGKVFGTGQGNYRMEVCHKVYGAESYKDTVYFKSDYEFHGGWYYSVLINNGKEVRIRKNLLNLRDISYNSCISDWNRLNADKSLEMIGFGNINCR